MQSGGYFEVLSTGIIPNLISNRGLALPNSTQLNPNLIGNSGVQFTLKFNSPADLKRHYNSQFWTFYTGSTSTGPFIEYTQLNKNQYKSTGILISSGSFLANRTPNVNFFAKALIKPLSVTDRAELLENSGNFALGSNEKIGIGIVSSQAQAKLHVLGDVKIDGNIGVGSLTASGLQASSNLSVGQAAYVGGNLSVGGELGVTTNFYVDGSSSFTELSATCIYSDFFYGPNGPLGENGVAGIDNCVTVGNNTLGSSTLGGCSNLISGSGPLTNNTILNGLSNKIVNNCFILGINNSILGGENNVISNATNTTVLGTCNRIAEGSTDVFHIGNFSFLGMPELDSQAYFDLFGTMPVSSQPVSDVFSFGSNIFVKNNHNVVFSDSRNLGVVDWDYSLYTNHLNGIKTAGAGLTINDVSYLEVDSYWKEAILEGTSTSLVDYNPFTKSTAQVNPNAYVNDKLKRFLGVTVGSNNINTRNYDAPGNPFSPDNLSWTMLWQHTLRDYYGYTVTGLLYSETEQFPINIGTNNRTFGAIITAAYKNGEIDYYGNAQPWPQVGRFNPTNNIIVGQSNQATIYDVIIGKNNIHHYNNNPNFGWVENDDGSFNYDTSSRDRDLVYSSRTPCMEESQANIYGMNNDITGNMINLFGSSNSIQRTKGDVSIVGHGNHISPQGYVSYVVGAATTPDGSLRSVNVGQVHNNFTTKPYRLFSNIFGQRNVLEAAAGGYLNVIGNGNGGNSLDNLQMMGADNYASGAYITIVGTFNNVPSPYSMAIGKDNIIQYGAGHTVIGKNNFIRNMINDQGIYPLGQVILGDFNTTSQSSYNTTIGAFNVLNHTGGNYNTFLGHSNTSFQTASESAVLGNSNLLNGRKTFIFGFGNSIDKINLSSGVNGPALLNSDSLENNLALGNQNLFGGSYSTALGQDNLIDEDNTLAMGNGAWTYNYGQKSYSPISLTDFASAEVVRNVPNGLSQKTTLIWRGISSGSNRQEIYLDNTAYDPNHNFATSTNFGPKGRAYIPSGRMWNGTLNVTIGEVGLANMRSIQQTFTIANIGNKNLPMNILTRNNLADVSIGTSLNSAGILFSGDNKNEKLAIWVTGIASKQIHWNISADFLDSWIPSTASELVPMRSQNRQSVVLI